MLERSASDDPQLIASRRSRIRRKRLTACFKQRVLVLPLNRMNQLSRKRMSTPEDEIAQYVCVNGNKRLSFARSIGR